MSGMTNNKRTVSNKKIVPVVKVEPFSTDPILEQSGRLPAEEPETMALVQEEVKKPLIKLKANKAYSNFAIGEGISVKSEDVIEVDFPTYQQINNDSPHAFERV